MTDSAHQETDCAHQETDSNDPAPSGRKRFRFPGILAAVLVIAAATYAPSLNNGFVYDDLSVLKDNICLGDPARLPSLFTREYFAVFSEYTYRPVCSLSYWVDAWLWKGRHRQNLPSPYRAGRY